MKASPDPVGLGPQLKNILDRRKPSPLSNQRYVRDVEAAAFLGVSAFTLRSWRSRGEPCGPPVTRMGKMVMYSMKELERYTSIDVLQPTLGSGAVSISTRLVVRSNAA
jgi:hypothetical protein